MELQDILTKAKITQAELASRLGISQPSVSNWRKRGIPIARVIDVERVTGIHRSKLRPDLFGGNQ